MLPLGLHVKMNIAGRDPSKWSVLGWFYNGIFYKTTEAFRRAFYSPKFEKLGPNVDGDWAQLYRQGEPFAKDTIPAPTMIQPEGGRYSVDAEEKYVEWSEYPPNIPTFFRLIGNSDFVRSGLFFQYWVHEGHRYPTLRHQIQRRTDYLRAWS